MDFRVNIYIKIKYYIIVLSIITLFIPIYFLQTRIETYKGVGQKIEEFMLLPKGEYLKPVVLGYEQLAGDIIWLKVIQVIGDKTVTPKAYNWVYHALDVVTTLDPKFSYVYQLGGVTLAVLAQQPDLSNKLLIKGFKENPDVWQIPFYIGFNYFFYLQDYKLAAEYMAKASELPGHPEYLPKLAARLYVQSGDPDVAIEFLYRMYKESNDEKVKESISNRIKEVTVEKDIRMLEGIVKKYKEANRAYPTKLTDLLTKGYISNIPSEPFGGHYLINPVNGNVYSSIVKKRMKLFIKGQE
ncbi:MAG: hypothetical protein HZA08_11440 [Nitrospirae bacterium]|nr:hypothetical protein [Nitrospirota bacterium]